MKEAVRTTGDMKHITGCAYNMDTGRVEARFVDGTVLRIDCVAVKDILVADMLMDGDTFYDIPDPYSEFEEKVISETEIARFRSALNEKDQTILQMWYHEHSLQEIADAVGFKTASAVSKHIRKIADAYEAFVSDAYSNFLDTHIQ